MLFPAVSSIQWKCLKFQNLYDKETGQALRGLTGKILDFLGLPFTLSK